MDLSFYEKIVDGWERTETANGVPYYVNHKTERTSWDHPYWTKIVEGLKEHDNVKYAAYRTSLKIRQLQKQLRLDQVDLVTVRNQFEELGHMEGTWESVHCDDLLTLLVNMYKDAHGNYVTSDEPDVLGDIALNLLLNLFDGNKTGFVKVMSAKIILVTLSAAKVTEKYKFFFQELHDPSTYINQRTLASFLEAIMKLPDFLHESVAFGRTTEPAVASCCQMGVETGGITEDVFYRWLHKEPQTLVWLPTFHRVIATENVTHDAKCSVCKASPITGFRYKCLKCFNFDLCQTCFFTGQIKKKHKTKHPIQEYCLNSTTKDDTAAFVKTLKNNLSRKQRRKSRLKYLPVEADGQYTNLAWSPGRESREPDIHDEISNAARRLADMEMSGVDKATQSPDRVPALFPDKSTLSPKDDGLQDHRDELNAIIRQLEEENRALYDQLASMKAPHSDTESQGSDTPPSHTFSPVVRRLPYMLTESPSQPVREPLPIETTPIYLSVPIIQVNGSHLDRLYRPLYTPPPPGPRSAFQPPVSSSPESALSPAFHHSQARGRTLGDSLDDLDTSPSRFSLPSPSKSHDDFHAEEAELAAIVDNAGRMFPADLSYTGDPSWQHSDEDDMLRAANSIGMAMSNFVNRAVNINLPQ